MIKPKKTDRDTCMVFEKYHIKMIVLQNSV